MSDGAAEDSTVLSWSIDSTTKMTTPGTPSTGSMTQKKKKEKKKKKKKEKKKKKRRRKMSNQRRKKKILEGVLDLRYWLRCCTKEAS